MTKPKVDPQDNGNTTAHTTNPPVMTIDNAMTVIRQVCANHVGNLQAHNTIQNALAVIDKMLVDKIAMDREALE